MSIYVLPNRRLFMPKRFELQMQGNVQVNRSPTNGAIRTAEMPGDQWAIRMEYSNRRNDAYPELRAFWNRFRGQAHVLQVWPISNPIPRGTLRGAPTLGGAAVEGTNNISVVGATGETLLPGDFLGIPYTAGGSQLVEVAEASGTGTIAVGLTAPLRRAANAGAAVVWLRPTANFLLTAAPFIPHSPAMSGGFSIEAVETIE